MTRIFNRIFIIILLLATALPGQSQKRKRENKYPSILQYDTSLYNAIRWRGIGPFRGGRSAAVTGVPGKPNLYYFGSSGGGVWQSKDAGAHWDNISDGFFGGSIGAVAVSTSDNNVIYVGGGESTVRGNVSYGSGLWKSVNAGKTWEHLGFGEAKHIVRIRIHPHNPDIVYAAVLGNLFSPSKQRGVYKSTDGGLTFKKVLFVNDRAGAIDLVIDPNNTRILYASTWKVTRSPYDLSSGGKGSGLWKSTDSGLTWKEITKNEGMPKGILGNIGIAVSPVNSDRIWIIIEAEKGGVYRSDDAGETWRKINGNRSLRQRAWYYSRIYADPKNIDVVYVLNVRYHKSTDGGYTFDSFNAPHGDHHDLWIAPENPDRMIIADDGGAQVTVNGGNKWSTYLNQPTAQFYRVTTDNAFPYRIYAAQQDNSSIRIVHRNSSRSISSDSWESTAGGESAHIAVDPENNDIVYGGSYGGFLTRYNHKNKQVRAINVWPDNPMGHGAEDMKYRFQWNFPLFFSPNNPKKLYAASNHLHVTFNQGQSWEVISPDLTRNDSAKLVSSGGPITKDNTGVEYYGTIFSAIESPYEEGLIWTGSDDGLVFVSRDTGVTWNNVTPTGMPQWMMINSIDANPFVKGGVYIAGTRYKSGDSHPYLYKTVDYGKTWSKITLGIDENNFTRVIRADPNRKGLLYAGTESGMYISFDDGASWKSFQLNLPIVPITDLKIKNGNLIASTQGRGIWIIDDLTPLYQLNETVTKAGYYLFKPMDSYRLSGPGIQKNPPLYSGQNRPGGAIIYYYLKEKPDSSGVVKLEILDASGKSIKTFSTDAEKDKNKLDVQTGMNVLNWNMRQDDAKRFDGMVLWWGSTRGPVSIPGTYSAKLIVNSDSVMQSFELLADPRSTSTQEDLKAQFDFLISIRDELTQTHEAIIEIRKAKDQLNKYKNRFSEIENREYIADTIKSVLKQMNEIETTLYQTKNRSGQDPLNYPIKLNNKLAHLASLAGMGNYPPTDQDIALKETLFSAIGEQLINWALIKKYRFPEIDDLIKNSGEPLIWFEE